MGAHEVVRKTSTGSRCTEAHLAAPRTLPGAPRFTFARRQRGTICSRTSAATWKSSSPSVVAVTRRSGSTSSGSRRILNRKTGQLLESARESLVLGVVIFNRPSDTGRIEGVLLFLNDAFEMPLKAIVLEKTGRIRGPRERYNYGYEKCIGICESQLHALNKDEALVLRNLNGFRAAAAHDVVEISEGLLYGHAQSAVQIFAPLLNSEYGSFAGLYPDQNLLNL